MKASKQVPIILIIFLAGCTLASTPKPEPVPTAVREPTKGAFSHTEEVPKTTPTHSATSTPTPTADLRATLSPQEREEIIAENIDRLTIIHSWDVDEVTFTGGQRSGVNIWSSNSLWLMVPIADNDVFGIQVFDINNYSKNRFINSGTSDSFSVVNSKIVVFQTGLSFYDFQGNLIQHITGESSCGVHYSLQMVSLPNTDNIITGHSIDGDISNSYGVSRILMWNITNNTCSDLISEFPGALISLTTDQKGEYLGYSVRTSYIDPSRNEEKAKINTVIFDIKNMRQSCLLDGGGDTIFTPDDQLLVYSSVDGTVLIIEPDTCAVILRLNIGIGFSSFAISPNGELLVATIEDSLKIWDFRTGEILNEVTITEPPNLIPAQVSFSPNGKYLALALDRRGIKGTGQIILFGIADKK